MSDDYRLSRFVDAQRDTYSTAVGELQNGTKTGHWMWFIFPQLAGLGRSEMAQHYAISSLDEARAYLEHPMLAARLLECTQLVIDNPDSSIEHLFGFPDNLKFRSCMTLFDAAGGPPVVFRRALEKYFDGAPDQKTLQLLQGPKKPGSAQ